MTFQRYRVTLRHNKGTVKVTTFSYSADAAKNLVLACEDAPESSVLSVEEVSSNR